MEEKIKEIDLDNKSTIKWWAILTSSINSILEKIEKVAAVLHKIVKIELQDVT